MRVDIIDIMKVKMTNSLDKERTITAFVSFTPRTGSIAVNSLPM